MEPITDENIRDLVKHYCKEGNTRGLPPIGTWDTSQVTNMSDLFSDYKTFNESLHNWNTSKVTTMKAMFYHCINFNQPLNNWNTSNVTNMSEMFYNCKNFNQPLNRWNTSNVTNMSEMFYHCKMFDQPLHHFDTSKVTNMESMFYNCKMFDQSLHNWNTSIVTDMSYMFYNCEMFDQSLNNWDTSKVTNMTEMFMNCKTFNQPLNNWDICDETNMDNMFHNCPLENNPSLQPSKLLALAKRTFENTKSKELKVSNKHILPYETAFDIIEQSDISVEQYLSEDPNNIVFKHKHRLDFSNKHIIRQLVMDGTAIKYGCKRIDTSLIPRKDNLYKTVCFDLSKIGISLGLVELGQIKQLLSINERKFEIVPTKTSYPSTASLQMLSDERNAVSASHCQEGQEAKLFTLKIIGYSSFRLTRKSLSKNEKKSLSTSKKTRKSIWI